MKGLRQFYSQPAEAKSAKKRQSWIKERRRERYRLKKLDRLQTVLVHKLFVKKRFRLIRVCLKQ